MLSDVDTGRARPPGAPDTPPRIFRLRWLVCGMIFLASASNYLDRQALGVLAPALVADKGWDAADYAEVVFWFQLGFALGFPLMGRVIDLLGARRGYALVVLLWSATTMWQGAMGSPSLMKAARFLFGINQSGNMPAGVKTISECFPPRERALAMGVFKSGSNLGAIAAPLLVPWLYYGFGWRATFLAIGAGGLLWAALWLWLCRAPRPAPPEAAATPATHTTLPPLPRIRWWTLLSRRETWAYMNFKFMTDAIWHWYLAMLPLFLHQRFGLTLAQFGAPLVIVYGIGSLGSVGGGWLSSHWIARGWDISRARKTAMLICCASTIPVMLVTQLPGMWICVSLIGLAHAAHQGLNSNLFTAVADIFPRQTVGAIVGLGGFAAQIGAALMMLASRWLLETRGNLAGMFFIAGAAYIVAFFIFHLLVPEFTPVDFAQRPKTSAPPRSTI